MVLSVDPSLHILASHPVVANSDPTHLQQTLCQCGSADSDTHCSKVPVCTTAGSSWCVYGANDSGIETFFAVLAGDIIPSADELTLPDKSGIISFKVQQEIYEEELRKDDSDYLNFPDPGTPARAFPPGLRTVVSGRILRYCRFAR